MSFRRTLAVVMREWREVVRDRLFFALAFVVPVSMYLMLGFGFSLDVDRLPLLVLDFDRSASSRAYLDPYLSSSTFNFRGYVASQAEASERLVRGDARLILVIPPGFERDLLANRSVSVAVWVDGTFTSRAQVIKGYLLRLEAAADLALAYRTAAIRGIVHPRLGPLVIEVRFLFNQGIRSRWSVAPKLIMAVLMVSPPFLTALGVVREKESGAIYNVYSSTLTVGEYLLGKLVPYVSISLLNAVVLTGLACGLFGAPFRGSLSFFAVATGIYVVCTTGLGLLVSVLVETQLAAIIVTGIVVFIPTLLYSGLLIPISSLSPSTSFVAHSLPGMYYTHIVDGCFLKGLGWSALWPDLAVLCLYAVILMGLGYKLFTKRPNR